MGAEVLSVAPHVMQTASDTQTPQGILAVLPIQRLPIPERANFVSILDGVRDPGNLGTILRTALAAGMDAVLLPPGTVDPFSPKVVRAGMGAHFKLPIHTLEWDEIRQIAKSLHLILYLADSSGGQPHHKSDFVSPLALIIGGEAEGAGVEAQGLAASRVHIPMPGEAESLNAAVAAAVLMFEVVRQRQS
jgi:TrmH family RNA methyltransferase